MENDDKLIRFLAEKVMDYRLDAFVDDDGVWVVDDTYICGRRLWNPLREGREGWADAGMLWERVQSDTRFDVGLQGFFGNYKGLVAERHGTEAMVGALCASGPRAISLAIARAYGWKENERNDHSH